MTRKQTLLILILTIASFSTIYTLTRLNIKPGKPDEFSGERALTHVIYQVNLGPRTMGSEAHVQAQEYLEDRLADFDWIVQKDSSVLDGNITINNITGKRGRSGPWILIGAHYDSRYYADQDQDPVNLNKPVPGANDGASGVGILLELANVIPENLDKQIWLVFFDAEDNGNIEGYDWIMGSQVFASKLSAYPDSVIIVDMVGDKDLNIYQELNSDPQITQEIWTVAQELGYNQFIPQQKYRILDDHIPFLNLGIPAVDIIDFDYPYWHTVDDTLDKVSAESLEAVGSTILSWILR